MEKVYSIVQEHVASAPSTFTSSGRLEYALSFYKSLELLRGHHYGAHQAF